MDYSYISSHVEDIRNFYNSRKTQSIAFRIAALERLYKNIKLYEQDILDALSEDLSKSNFESYATEVSIILKEIQYHIRHLKRWSKARKVGMSLLFFPSKSCIVQEPYGVVLIIAPWNYPFQLLISPLIGAISAGNCVVLKSSPKAPATSEVIEKIVNNTFQKEYVAFFQGHRDVNQTLLENKFDYIFFTGSPSMGKIVMEGAAKHLTPVTLELGGKSPCIIESDANIKIAARRIIWGKTLNSGQTCVAPDYLLVHKDIRENLLLELQNSITEMYGENPKDSPDYPRIISLAATTRLASYLKEGKILLGGDYDLDDNYIAPTVIGEVSEESAIMQDEIFGPIFPLIEYSDIKEVITFVNNREKPLALYYFTNDKKKAKQVLSETSSGGACINDTIVHVGSHKLPFGGVGNSGMGRYHGKFSFDTFSNQKSVVFSSGKIDIKLKYPPYKDKYENYRDMLTKF